MDNLEVTIEEQLMDIFSMPDINQRVTNSGLCKYEYKEGLIDSLKNGEIRNGKTAEETLINYENHIKWQKFKDKLEEKANKVIWTLNGTIPLAFINTFILSYASRSIKPVDEINLPIKYWIGGIAVLSLAEFFAIKHGVSCFFKRYEKSNDYEEETQRLKNNAPAYNEILGSSSRINCSKKEEVASSIVK